MMPFFRAANCFSSAEDTLSALDEIGKDKAVGLALIECSNGLSSIRRDQLTEPAIEWVSELSSFLDYSGLEVPKDQGGIPTKAATLTAAEVGRIAELVKNLQRWFSAENRKGM
ncbi:hypothetical protein [Pseudomonas sp. CCI3.1]|uniref:hypothetical protein n=1 Tax=Pseudomonas sp. CCI3.1 TaxID=3048618 RepID=UPI002AB591DA|nr:MULTISPECIES: hypothetical protein [unclassified Pseudomonas]MDY7584710.1 hypothetical protein [Pseudomonas sp. CCI3.1]MEB0066668.1 hypothetical protein [Pseudomonas sp. CCI3.1]MEB0071965.1 hypothetical protein [Pseudomonas sp. CCI1.4]